MSIRTFLFCDVCNPKGIRCPEQRRDMRRRDTNGRRATDARSWYEGDPALAVEEDHWVAMDGGSYLCPGCSAKGLTPDNPDKEARGLQTFVFCDLCNPQGFRFVENRRDSDARSVKTGRRITDGRAWAEPDLMQGKNWVTTADDNHYCQKCVEQHPTLTVDVAS